MEKDGKGEEQGGGDWDPTRGEGSSEGTQRVDGTGRGGKVAAGGGGGGVCRDFERQK